MTCLVTQAMSIRRVESSKAQNTETMASNPSLGTDGLFVFVVSSAKTGLRWGGPSIKSPLISTRNLWNPGKRKVLDRTAYSSTDTDRQMDGRMDGWTDTRTDETDTQTDGRTNGQADGRTDKIDIDIDSRYTYRDIDI